MNQDEHDPGGKVRIALPANVLSSAMFSSCGKYRYELHRRWNIEDAARSIMFIMMNPSTATHDVDDPTVRKCRTLADMWGYNHLIVTNVMAYRATNPKDLLTVDDPVGPSNLFSLYRLCTATGIFRDEIVGDPDLPFLLKDTPTIVCAWGRIPKKLAWAEYAVINMVAHRKPNVLRLNKSGRPWHPLYLPNNSTLQRWEI